MEGLTLFGKIRTKLYKSGSEVLCVFNKNNMCTSSLDNMTYNIHSAWYVQLTVVKPTTGMEWISPIPKIYPKCHLGII